MYVRIHKQKQRGKVYASVLLCESYRDPAKGNAPRNRVLLNLGPLEKIGTETLQALANGFARAAGNPIDGESLSPTLLASRDFGHFHAVSGVWDRLGLSDSLIQAGINGETSFNPAAMIRLLVINRLCEPCSKWALLDWLEGVHWDGGEKPSYHHLLRAMDHLIEVKEKAEPLMARRLLRKDEPLDLVFYDITSTYFEGDRSLAEGDVRRFGYSRDHRNDRRQVVIGLVMTREGIPLCHHVFPGNTADKSTVTQVIQDLKVRFNLGRVVFVGDRGMLSDANLETLLSEELGFIVAHPLRKNQLARDVIGVLSKQFERKGETEQFFEECREGVRFVVAFSPERAKEVGTARKKRLAKADAWFKERLDKLAAPSAKGRQPTPQGTYDRIRDYLRDHGLLGFYEVTLADGKIAVQKDRQVLTWENKIDGILMVETTDLTLPAEEVIRRYKELAEIERGWRSLKSTLLLRPVYHWSEERIRAHVFVCVLALQVERWMRLRLAPLGTSVSKCLASLQQIKRGEIEVGGRKQLLPSRPTQEQKKMLEVLGVPPIPAMFGEE
jgi:transposase